MLTIAELIKESHGTAVKKGWWEDMDRNFGEQLMLFVTEITEVWELTLTGMPGVLLVKDDETGKPAGLATELADLWIRMADTVGRYEIPLEAAMKYIMGRDANFDISTLVSLEGTGWVGDGSVLISLMEIISHISYAMEEYRVNGLNHSKFFLINPVTAGASGMAVHFARVFLVTAALCRDYDIPLAEALEAKLAYNKSRPYRHGNKIA